MIEPFREENVPVDVLILHWPASKPFMSILILVSDEHWEVLLLTALIGASAADATVWWSVTAR